MLPDSDNVMLKRDSKNVMLLDYERRKAVVPERSKARIYIGEDEGKR